MLLAQHLPGKTNIRAYYLSRYLRDRMDWVLNFDIFFRAIITLCGAQWKWIVLLLVSQHSCCCSSAGEQTLRLKATDAYSQAWSARVGFAIDTIDGFAHQPSNHQGADQGARRGSNNSVDHTPLWQTAVVSN